MGIILVHVSVADDRHAAITNNPASQTDHIEYNLLTMAGYYVSPSKIRPVVRRVRFCAKLKSLHSMLSISLRG